MSLLSIAGIILVVLWILLMVKGASRPHNPPRS